MPNRKGFVLIGLMAAIALIPTAVLVAVKAQQSVHSATRYFTSSKARASMSVLRDFVVQGADDPDDDGTYELPVPTAPDSIPGGIPLSPNDDFGTPYRYCAWDTGLTGLIGYSAGPPPVAGLLGRVISAGADTTFSTDCNSLESGGDDIVVDIHDANVNYASGALGGWRDNGSFVTLLNPNDLVAIGSNDFPTHRLEIAAEVEGGDRSLGGVAIGKAVLYNNEGNSLQLDVAGGDFKINGGGLQLGAYQVLTADGNLTVPGETLTMDNASRNTLLFEGGGSGLPTSGSRTAGTRIVLAPSADGFATADYAMGVASGAGGTFWMGMPSPTAAYSFSWYGGDRLAMQLDGDGHLGIGRAPGGDGVNDYALDVNGAVHVTAESSPGYYLNGKVLRTGGDWLDDELMNLKGGTGTLGANVDGAYNVAAGYRALAANTSGYSNVAIGYQAAYRHGTEGAGENIAIGRESLAGSAAATENRGYGNVAVGSAALADTSAGSYNVALGYNAGAHYGGMFSGMGASYNIALGFHALEGVSGTVATGSNNFAAGSRALANGTAGSGNIAVGEEAARYAGSAASASNNIALGKWALHGQSAAVPASGSDNFAAGVSALASATSGSYNVAVGQGAGEFITTGDSNVAIGRKALAGTSIAAGAGSNNIAIGEEALTVTTASTAGNIAIGRWAGRYNGAAAAGIPNIAIGESALSASLASPLTGGGNIATGTMALAGLSSGSHNIASGHYAGRNLTTGTGNIALGPRALLGAAGEGAAPEFAGSGSYNIALGDSSLQMGSTGAHNVALGYRAGSNVGGDTFGVGTNNIALGQEAMVGSGVAAANTANNNLAAGYRALYVVSSGSYNLAAGYQALISATTASGNIAVGKNAAQYLGSGSNNIALGSSALAGKDTVAGTVSDSVAIGAGALGKATAGSYNIAIGGGDAAAGFVGEYLGQSAAASKNIAVGYGAMAGSDVSGDAHDNIALGSGAMARTIYGYSNVVLGQGAAAYLGAPNPANGNRGAFWNVAIGQNAMAGDPANLPLWSSGAVTLASSNVAVGTDAMLLASGGSSNVAIGASAMRNMALPYDLSGGVAVSYANVAIGQQALAGEGGAQAKTNGGSQNVAIGNYALEYGGKARENVAIGEGAGRYLGNLPSSQYNIAIGSSALLGRADSSLNSGAYNLAIGLEALYSNAAASSNIAIGARAGKYLGAGGSGANVAIGEEALRGSSVALDLESHTGAYNTAVGYHAMLKNTSGSYNLAMGYEALAEAAGAYYNTAVGYGAGRNFGQPLYVAASGEASPGSGNTAVGYNALAGGATPAGNTGYGNVAVGLNTLAAASAGFNNVAIGSNAARYAGNGANSYNNIAIGRSALYGNSGVVNAGHDNVAAGAEALYANTLGSYNVAIGHAAGRNIGSAAGSEQNIAIGWNTMEAASGASGKGNVAIGSSAGKALSAGSNNLAVGGFAGSELTTGSDNIAIGSNAGNLISTGSYNIAIGAGASGSTTASAASATNTGSYNIAIGTGAGVLFGSGNSNIAVGVGALPGSIAGGNIAIGENAGLLIGRRAGGTRNIAIGGLNFAAAVDTSRLNAADNIGIGCDALGLSFNQTGNIAIGVAASRTLGPLDGTTAAVGNNVAIGQYALGGGGGSEMSWTASANHNVAIGYRAGDPVFNGTGNLFLGAYAGNQETNRFAVPANTVNNRIIIDTLSRGSQKTVAPLYVEVNSDLAQQKIYLNGKVYVSTLTTNGNVLATGGLLSSSDIRLKTNIVPLNHDGRLLERVGRLTGVYYDWRVDDYPERGLSRRRQIGFIAQEVEQVFPELVHTDAAGFKSMSYDKLTAVLVEAAKLRQQQLDDHERRLGAAEASVEQLETIEIQGLRDEIAALRARLQAGQ